MVDWNWFGPISDSCVICNWKSWTDVASLLTLTVTCPLARLSVSMVSQYQSQVAFNNGTIVPKLSLNCMVYVSVAEKRVEIGLVSNEPRFKQTLINKLTINRTAEWYDQTIWWLIDQISFIICQHEIIVKFLFTSGSEDLNVACSSSSTLVMIVVWNVVKQWLSRFGAIVNAADGNIFFVATGWVV